MDGGEETEAESSSEAEQTEAVAIKKEHEESPSSQGSAGLEAEGPGVPSPLYHWLIQKGQKAFFSQKAWPQLCVIPQITSSLWNIPWFPEALLGVGAEGVSRMILAQQEGGREGRTVQETAGEEMSC